MRGLAALLLAVAMAPAWASATEPRAPRTPEAIVKDTCILCHGTGIGDAPRLGDARPSEKRRARGRAMLVKTAADGKGAMPPRGGMPDLTDEELRSVVAYLSGLAPR